MSSDDDDYYIDDPYDVRPGAQRPAGGGGGKKRAGGTTNNSASAVATTAGTKPGAKNVQNQRNAGQQQQQQAQPQSKAGNTASKSPANKSPQLTGLDGSGAGRGDGKLTSSDKILNRLRWDDVLDLREFDIMYEDRFKGMMSIPAARFRGTEGQGAEGDAIPWHRVHQFLYKGRIVWDRDAHINLIDQLADEIRAVKEAAEASAQQQAESGTTSLRFLGGERLKIVKPQNPNGNRNNANNSANANNNDNNNDDDSSSQQQPPMLAANKPLRVVTYNILHDIFDSDAIYTEARIPLICKEIEDQKPDVIFLQEVTLPRFRDLLRTSTALRQNYFWTYYPSEVSSCQMTGSRFPLMEAFAESVSKNKRRIYALMENPWAPMNSDAAKALPVLLVNCHFISDHGGGAVNRRLGEVKDIGRNIATFPRVILAGDFNFGDQNQESSVVFDRLSDAWVEDYKQANGITGNDFAGQDEIVVAGGMPKQLSPIGGFTFDITRNPLANLSCEHHRYPRRLDRIMFRAFDVVPNSSKVFAVQPYPLSAVPKEALEAARANGSLDPNEDKIYPSDHFGVYVELSKNDAAFLGGGSNTAGAAAASSSATGGNNNNSDAAASASFIPRNIDPVVAAMSKAGAFSKFFRSALVFIPPPALFDKINRFRENGRDKAFPRWMPHFTILFPFVHPSKFGDAIALIDAALKTNLIQQGPFRMRIRKHGIFARGGKSVVFLQPECIAADRSDIGIAPMRAVFEPLQYLFPSCGRNSGGGENDDDNNNSASAAPASSGAAPAAAAASSTAVATTDAAQAAASYAPHMTLGYTSRGKDHDSFIARITAEWEPTEFDVSQFHLIAHLDGKDGFEVIHTFDLPTASSANSSGAAAAAASSSSTKAAAAGDNEKQFMATVLEPPQYGSRLLKPYCPPDPLEKWMAAVTNPKYARDAPTHISQLGGMYHIPSDMIDEYLARWKESFLCREHVPGYMEEIRGNPFRLYVDLDFDLTVPDLPVDRRYGLDLVREICIFTQKLFPSSDPTVAVFECHGSASSKFADGSIPSVDQHNDDVLPEGVDAATDVRHGKSGYRIYFQRVFVDDECYDKYLTALSNYLRRKSWPYPENLVRGVTWDDIIDKKAVVWNRGRLLGTIKRRKNLKRIYSLAAVVDIRGTNELLTKELEKSVLRQLYGSTLRLWDTLPRPDPQTGLPVLMDNEFTMARLNVWDADAEAAAATAHETK